MKILITRKLPASVLSRLEAIGQIDLYAGDGAMPAAELRERIIGVDAAVTMVHPMSSTGR